MLAQDWLYGEQRAPSPYDHYVERHLKLPTTFNPHTSFCVLNNIAERIVFTDDVPSLLYEMYDNKQLTYEGVLGSCRLPYDCFWLEYASKVGLDDVTYKGARYGALIVRLGVNAVRMYIISGLLWTDTKGELHDGCSLTHVVDFNAWPPLTELRDDHIGISFAVQYAFNARRMDDASSVQRAELASVVVEMIFGIFLVTQPKVYSVDTVTWKNSHKRKRALAGKAPLLEYKKLRLHIGRTHKHYAHRPAITPSNTTETDSDAAVQHRRYHKVMGHFRHYNDHDPPHTTWIEAHYRGDPALGVTFTERDVSK